MRALILCAVVCMSFAAQAVEYGYFSRAHTSSNWSHSVTLEEGDRFVVMNVDSGTYSNGSLMRPLFSVRYDSVELYRSINIWRDYKHNDVGYSIVSSEAMRTINGPCTIEPHVSNDSTKIIDYKIIRSGEDESKFTVALNAQGTRMAIGNKSGTNGVARVFEFNGTDWEQLGSDVE